jgi:membrane protease subunit (stomatin/prohibitin family)
MAQMAMGMQMGQQMMAGMQQPAQPQPQQTTPPQQKSAPAAAPGWACPCGHGGNTGKFCAECGKPQPVSDSWTCACGAMNKGKFCAECGKPKPAGTPQYKCDKCGWEPEDKARPPKFCPECGDPFDDGDIQ